MPVSVALGPCLMDYTSPVSYRPRASPMGQVGFPVGTGSAELCYGRPAARGRPIYGGLVPFDTLWRMGANEPTRLYTDAPITLAGIALAPGRYSLYAMPGPRTWTIFASRSIRHWGNDLSPAVRGQEVGRASIMVESLAQPVETLTVTAQDSGSVVLLHLDWESTRITLPVRPAT
ncbi:MAG: DUF2911 domain-containing protein [Gemmatimonadales bacterium]